MRLLIAVMAASAAWAQVATEANSRYRTAEDRQHSVTKNVARFEERDRSDKPEELIAAMGLKPGMTVVDLGAGTGYMLPYLSAAVGANGRVIAVDIFEEFLAAAKRHAAEKNLDNVEFVLGTDTDPKIPTGEADLVLTLDVYHHFDYPEKTVGGLRRGLKEGGRFVVVDFYKDSYDGDPKHVRLEQAELIREVEGLGFRLVSKADHDPGKEYITIFAKQ